MALKDIVPWRKQTPAQPVDYFHSFREQLDRLFNEFWSDFPSSSLGGGLTRFENRLGTFVPSIEVSEDKDHVKIQAELPGLNENDIQLTLTANGEQLILKGEKKFEEERKEESFYRSERAYGTFQRVVSLPARVNPEKVNATFKDGVLAVKLAKLPESESGSRQIRIGK
jgi:HSP20 family protein